MDEKEAIEHASDNEAELNGKADTSKLLNDADLSQSDQEFIKQRSDIFSKGSNISYNITINQISGDNISGNAQKIDFGEQNEFDDVTIGNKNDADESPLEKRVVKVALSDNREIYEYLKENR